MVKNQAEQDLLNVEREITAAQQNRIFLSSQLQTAQVNSTAGSVQALEDEYKRKLTVYDASHPDMVALRQPDLDRTQGRFADADGSLQSELEDRRQTLAEARSATARNTPT